MKRTNWTRQLEPSLEPPDDDEPGDSDEADELERRIDDEVERFMEGR